MESIMVMNKFVGFRELSREEQIGFALLQISGPHGDEGFPAPSQETRVKLGRFLAPLTIAERQEFANEVITHCFDTHGIPCEPPDSYQFDYY